MASVELPAAAVIADKLTADDGVAQVASPRQNVVDDALVPLFRLVTGKLPVTPVVSGRPVALVKTAALGVPSAGVVSVGEVERTTSPVPVVDAALITVPLPCNMPVTVVLSVIAGVVVAVSTEPARPFAVTTDTDVTEPEPAPFAEKFTPAP